jgi:hypothetical protein
LAILSWFENYSEEEVPHENLWDDAEGLEQHFKAVMTRREDGRSFSKSDDEEDEMLGNDLAGVFK